LLLLVSGFPFVLAVGAAGIAAIAAGCGGSNPSSVASLPSTTGTTSTSQGGAKSAPRNNAAFVTCLRSHGLQASLGSAGGTGGSRIVTFFGVAITGADPASPQFQAALNACRKYLPGGGPPALTPAQQAEARWAYTRFAACMRSHGVPGFPDPNGAGFFPPGSLQKIGPGSPTVTKAFRTCESLEPKVGPRLSLG
jgi:hypothetical protein